MSGWTRIPHAISLIALVLTLTGCGAMNAQNPGEGLSPVNAIATDRDDHLMLFGADVVAYFTDNQYIQGSPEFRSAYQGVDFHFASAANKARFDAETFWYRMRDIVRSSSWLNEMFCLRTAWYSLTGIATNPNEIVPLHTGRAMARVNHNHRTVPGRRDAGRDGQLGRVLQEMFEKMGMPAGDAARILRKEGARVRGSEAVRITQLSRNVGSWAAGT